MSRRRGNGEGSISKRKDGRWWGRYTVHTANGPKQKAVYGKTRAEVAEKLTKAMADRDGGFTFDAENLKLGGYLDRWLIVVRNTIRKDMGTIRADSPHSLEADVGANQTKEPYPYSRTGPVL